MKQYLSEKEEVLKELKTTSQDGLASSEAEARLAVDGKNRLAEGEKGNAFSKADFANRRSDGTGAYRCGNRIGNHFGNRA